MDINLLGELIVASAASQTNKGFWMPAGGNNGVAGIEVFFNSDASAFTVTMQTKSSDEADSSATSIGSVTITSTSATTYKFDVSNAKDLVRYVTTSGRGGKVHRDAHCIASSRFLLRQPLAPLAGNSRHWISNARAGRRSRAACGFADGSHCHQPRGFRGFGKRFQGAGRLDSECRGFCKA